MNRIKKISIWRVLALIVLGMLIFNTYNSFFIESQDSINLINRAAFIIFFSIAGLIITPAPIGLAIHAIIVESLFNRGVFKNHWILAVSSGVIGITLFAIIFFMLKHNFNVNLNLVASIFIAHSLAAMLVYFRKL